jgi:hypothetical protein
MEKYYNLKHEVQLDAKLYPTSKGAKDGDVVEHFQDVQSAQMYYYSDAVKAFIQVVLPKDMILDLAEQIKEIESTNITCKYDSGLPF